MEQAPAMPLPVPPDSHFGPMTPIDLQTFHALETPLSAKRHYQTSVPMYAHPGIFEDVGTPFAPSLAVSFGGYGGVGSGVFRLGVLPPRWLTCRPVWFARTPCGLRLALCLPSPHASCYLLLRCWDDAQWYAQTRALMKVVVGGPLGPIRTTNPPLTQRWEFEGVLDFAATRTSDVRAYLLWYLLTPPADL